MKLNKEFKNKINYLFDILAKNEVQVMTVRFYGSGDDGGRWKKDSYDLSCGRNG